MLTKKDFEQFAWYLAEKAQTEHWSKQKVDREIKEMVSLLKRTSGNPRFDEVRFEVFVKGLIK